MGERVGAGPEPTASREAARLRRALAEERAKVGPLGIWYDWHREWLEVMAEVAHRWGAPEPGRWVDTAGSKRDGWNATARRQAMNWTVDPDAVIAERSLSFVAASRISLDPIAAAVGAGVEARLVPLWYSQQIPDAYSRNFVVAAESTMPEAITELSHNAWDPQLLAPAERFAWEMIPRWIWRSHARLTAKHDGMPEVLDVPEPPWSDPLVLEVSEWWARRQTEAFDAELREMALTFERRLEQLGLELTAQAARRGLGPAVLERAAFAVRREALAQEDVYDALRECEQVMQDALRSKSGAAPPEGSGGAAALGDLP